MSGTAHESTRKVLIDMFQACQAFGQRTMAERAGDISVGILLRAVEPIAQPVIDERIKVAKDILDDMDESEGASIRLELLIQVAQAEFDAVVIKYELPELTRIKKRDLPKAQKGPDGWRNATGIGRLIFWLGPLYDWGEDVKPKETDPNDPVDD